MDSHQLDYTWRVPFLRCLCCNHVIQHSLLPHSLHVPPLAPTAWLPVPFHAVVMELLSRCQDLYFRACIRHFQFTTGEGESKKERTEGENKREGVREETEQRERTRERKRNTPERCPEPGRHTAYAPARSGAQTTLAGARCCHTQARPGPSSRATARRLWRPHRPGGEAAGPDRTSSRVHQRRELRVVLRFPHGHLLEVQLHLEVGGEVALGLVLAVAAWVRMSIGMGTYMMYSVWRRWWWWCV
jgi:hypothetical protein